MNLGRIVTGWASVQVSGAEPERILTALAERGISFWDAAPPKDFVLTLEVPWRVASLIPPLAETMGLEGKILRRHGLPALLSSWRHRVLLGVFLLMALLLVWSSAYIWDIDITGNDSISEGAIRQALAECGVDIGKTWVGMSQDQVRNSMILKLPEIEWMTVSIRGSRATVIVKEKVEAIDPLDEGELVKIVAEKAGLITDVIALRGTAETEANRAVLPGETLIGGYATGRFGVIGPVRAIGEVWARTWYEITMEAPATVEKKVYTGQQKTLYALILGKTRINFYKGCSICTQDRDKIIERYTVGKEGVFTLPITLEKITFQTYGTQSQEALALQAQMETALMEELMEQIGEGGEVRSAQYTVSQKDGALYVTLHAECWEEIGTEQPLTDDDLMDIQSRIPTTEDTEEEN